MRLPQFEYIEPRSLKEASKTLAFDPTGSVLFAGGTDLFVRMKQGLVQPRRVINLKSIPGLSYISAEKEGVRIGALTPLNDLASSPLLNKSYPALVQSAREVGAYAHQVMGTLGGNLCQENRCRYYNQSAFWRGVRPPCRKAGGKACYVVSARSPGDPKTGECHSAYCGDVAPVLMAMSAQARVIGPDGERTFPLKRLYTRKGKKPLSLRRGEILEEISIPSPAGKTLYLKWRRRDSIEFPVLSLALHVENGEGGKIENARVVFSGIDPGPVETSETEKRLKGVFLGDRLPDQVSDKVAKEISPMRTSLVSPAFKRKLAGTLLRQAFEKIRAL